MILTLERKGLIQGTPGEARSIRVLVPAEDLPRLSGVGTGSMSPAATGRQGACVRTRPWRSS